MTSSLCEPPRLTPTLDHCFVHHANGSPKPLLIFWNASTLNRRLFSQNSKQASRQQHKNYACTHAYSQPSGWDWHWHIMALPTLTSYTKYYLNYVTQSNTRCIWVGTRSTRAGYQLGRWAKAIDVTHPELALSSEQVMTQLIRIIWTFILDLWKVRNTHLHQPTKQLNLPKYRQAIVNLSEQHQQLPPDAQAALYHQPLEVLLEQPAPRLQTWAQRGMRYFNQQLRAAKSQAKLHTPDIRTFFGQQAQPIDNLQPPWETLLHWTSVGLLCTQ